MGNRCQPSQTGSPNPLAFVPPGRPGCGFALEPKHPFKGFLSPSTCLGFNSVLAHLSWVIKHERAEPRDLPVLCSAERGGGSLRHLPGWLGSKESDVPTGGRVPPVPAAWTQRVHRPCSSCSGFILPMQCPRLPGKREQSKLIPGRDGSTVCFTCYHATHNLHTLATMRTCHHSPAPLPGSLSFWDKGWVLFLSFQVNFQHKSAVKKSQGGRCTFL